MWSSKSSRNCRKRVKSAEAYNLPSLSASSRRTCKSPEHFTCAQHRLTLLCREKARELDDKLSASRLYRNSKRQCSIYNHSYQVPPVPINENSERIKRDFKIAERDDWMPIAMMRECEFCMKFVEKIPPAQETRVGCESRAEDDDNSAAGTRSKT